MDPASIVGLAAAGLQFLTFTAKVATGGWRAVGVAKDLPIQAAELAAASNNFNSTVIQMNVILEAIDTAEQGELSGIERATRNVCVDCRDKAHELHDATAALAQKLNDGSRIRSLWEALRQELGSGRLDKLTADMSGYQQQLLTVTVSSLWEDSKQNTQHLLEMRKQMTALQKAITQLSPYEVIPNLREGFRHDSSSDTIVDPLRLADASSGIDWTAGGVRGIRDEIMEAIAENKEMSVEPMEETEVRSPLYKQVIKDVIQSLSFDAMGNRQNNIHYPLESTLEWIWQRQTDNLPGTPSGSQWSSFPNWLEEDCSRPYWITGKPGCGKSTLMRHIENHCKLREHLEDWRPGTPLRVLSFYAWNPGMDSEKSIDGLLRTILVQGLQELPALIPIVFPRRWTFSTTMWGAPYPQDWELEDFRNLEDGLYRFLKASQSRMRLMMLIDGLDEFDEAPKRLIKAIEQINLDENVKLCVASRPWTKFADHFAKSPTLAMDKLTGNDIQIYTAQKFNEVLASQDRLSEVEYLREKVHQHAEGVFQWVVVVVNFLIDKLEQGNSLQTLLDVIDALPRELASLYSAIWSRISSDLREKAEVIFLLMFASCRNELDFRTLWAVNERHTTNTALLTETARDTDKIKNIVSRMLNSRTLGLLEINSLGFVDYLHRTVPEWVSKETILRDSPVQPDHAILHGLCIWGPYLNLDPMYDTDTKWTETLLLNVSYHTTKIAGDPALAILNPDEVVDWLCRLERKLQVHAGVYPFIGRIPLGMPEPYYSLEPDRFVQLIGACGFKPFIDYRLSEDEGVTRTNIFSFCLYAPIIFCFPPSDNTLHWDELGQRSTTSRLGCVQLCLDHGADMPLRLKAGNQGQRCSVKDVVRETVELAKLFHEHGKQYNEDWCGEVAIYYLEVAKLIKARSKTWRKKRITQWLISRWGQVLHHGWPRGPSTGPSPSSSARSSRQR